VSAWTLPGIFVNLLFQVGALIMGLRRNFFKARSNFWGAAKYQIDGKATNEGVENKTNCW